MLIKMFQDKKNLIKLIIQFSLSINLTNHDNTHRKVYSN